MDTIKDYNNSLEPQNKSICDLLRQTLDNQLLDSTSKLYHGAPVWFMNDNPLVGYSLKKGKIALLFWSGQSFKNEGLIPLGKFKAAEISFKTVQEIPLEKIKLWLEESKYIIWDYKNIVKNNGNLTLLK